MPKRATMPATMTTNAPVGPPIWVREPPSAEIRKPATTACIEAGLRRDAGGDAEGHGQRQCDQAHRDSCQQIVKECLKRVIS
jgi:hypothetical protein